MLSDAQWQSATECLGLTLGVSRSLSHFSSPSMSRGDDCPVPRCAARPRPREGEWQGDPLAQRDPFLRATRALVPVERPRWASRGDSPCEVGGRGSDPPASLEPGMWGPAAPLGGDNNEDIGGHRNARRLQHNCNIPARFATLPAPHRNTTVTVRHETVIYVI